MIQCGSLCNLAYFDTTEGQPDSIVQDIENMVRSFIEKVLSIPSYHPFVAFLSNIFGFSLLTTYELLLFIEKFIFCKSSQIR